MRPAFSILAAALSLSPAAMAAGPLSPEESLSHFKLDPRLKIEIIAAEPLVVDPVAIAFDKRGRMFVVENRGYPSGPGDGTPPAGRVALLEDSDGDGRYDKRSEFADGLDFPNGVMAWSGGALVTCAPDLLYLKDENGDGRADKREAALTGFSLGGSTQLRASHPTLGVDNWIYLTNGLSGGEIKNPARPELPAVKMGNLNLRWNPLTGAVETCAGQGQFGLAFDEFGRMFVCSNRKHIEHVVLQPNDLARNPKLEFSDTVAEIPDHGEAAKIFPISANRTTAYAHVGTFTAACGIAIYLGNALPLEFRGNAFVCDPTGNLVHRDLLSPAGATFIARRAEEEGEFLASDDDWFRPVFLANGPDGALYLCDMYRGTIEHPVYLPPDVAAKTDFEAGKDRGRIYRITARAAKPAPLPRFPDDSPDALVGLLGSENAWVAGTAQRLLLEARSAAAVEPLRKALGMNGAPAQRARALWLLNALGQIDSGAIRASLKDSDAGVRENAALIGRARLKDFSDLAGDFSAMIADTNARVAFVVALALGDSDSGGATLALAQLASQHAADSWTRAAVLSGIAGRSSAFIDAFLSMPTTGPGMAEFLDALALSAALDGNPEGAIRIMDSAILDPSHSVGEQIAAARGAYDGLRRTGAKTSGERTRADELLLELMDRARAIIAEPSQSLPLRCTAAGLVGMMGFRYAGETLLAALAPASPPELQLAAARALAATKEKAALKALADPERWGGYRPAARSAVGAALAASADGAKPLLESVEGGKIPAWSVDASARSALMKSRDPETQKRAKALFESAGAGDRKKAFEEAKPLLALPGHAAAGKEVFEKNCAACHVFMGAGSAVGPDLSDLRAHPAESILMHVLMPNWLLEPGYENYEIETKKGETVSGIVKAETPASVTLRRALGEESVIPREEIKAMRPTSLSIMPEEFEKALSPQELRDLIAFLKGEEGG